MAKQSKFEITKSKKNQNFYVTLVAPNGEVVAVSEGYKRLVNALKWRKKLVKWAKSALMRPCEKK